MGTGMIRARRGALRLPTLFVAAVCLLSPLAGTAAADADGAANGIFFSDWHLTSQKTHPLAGKVWSRATGGLVDPKVLADAIATTPIVIVGETHDNNDQHRIQAHIVDLLVKAGKRPAAVFEQLRGDVQAEIDKLAPAGPISLAAFKAAVAWDKSGWQKYDYDPLLAEVLKDKLAIYAGDVPKPDMMKVAKDGAAALSKDTRTALGLEMPLGAKADKASLDEIFEAHCKMMPREALTNMAYAQRYRDAHLADAVIRAVAAHGSALLFAGSGHARTDRAVPWYLERRLAGTRRVSIMMVEVDAGKTAPAAYALPDPDGKPTADFLIFTPVFERGDPCEGLKERMLKAKAKK